MNKILINLVITDLDNTLYDWVSFFSSAFFEMVREAAPLLDASEDEIIEDLRHVHIKHQNIEHPFALLETKSALAKYGNLSRRKRAEALNDAFHAFNRVRKQKLKLYPGVFETLRHLHERCDVVAHTEATAANASFRLTKLGIEHLIAAIYAVKDSYQEHPNAERLSVYAACYSKVRMLEKHQLKPNPEVVLRICGDQRVRPEQTLYVGDSITKDVAMAKAAGSWAAWARYGTIYDSESWEKLFRVTHWNSTNAREGESFIDGMKPDRILEKGFDELLLPSHSSNQPTFIFGRKEATALTFSE